MNQEVEVRTSHKRTRREDEENSNHNDDQEDQMTSPSLTTESPTATTITADASSSTMSLRDGSNTSCLDLYASSATANKAPSTEEGRITKLKDLCMTSDLAIQQEILSLERSFKNLGEEYCLVDKIGEGTFSSVYKAIDVKYHQHKNNWDTIYNDSRTPTGVQFVALKRIYVTSSPRRILNELKLLHKLSDSVYIAPIITALRHQDQILVVLPYFQHVEFRNYFRYLTHAGIRRYMSDLLCGLEFIHSKRIIHRDIKPANFLFDPIRGYGVLVDFGLAELETDSNTCACTTGGLRKRITHVKPQKGYKKEDRRPGRHANRAGTRGFRAPEVLYRCTNQTTKIDMWSVGVVLLSILTRRVPFFNSTDDEDALIEIATIWGRQLVNNCALLHGLVFESTVPNIPDNAYDLEDIVGCFSGRPMRKNKDGTEMFDFDTQEIVLLDLLKSMLELNFKKRFSATQCLTHPFFDVKDDPSVPLLDKKGYTPKKKLQEMQAVVENNPQEPVPDPGPKEPEISKPQLEEIQQEIQQQPVVGAGVGTGTLSYSNDSGSNKENQDVLTIPESMSQKPKRIRLDDHHHPNGHTTEAKSINTNNANNANNTGVQSSQGLADSNINTNNGNNNDKDPHSRSQDLHHSFIVVESEA